MIISKVPSYIKVLANWKAGPKEIGVVLYDLNMNKFIGAIELDGARYHSSLEKISLDYERQVFLENMGWEFVRLDWHSFYKNREQAVIDILEKFQISQFTNA